MKNERMVVDDPWVLTRAGHFSSSFSNFLLQISPDMSEKERKELEKAGKELKDVRKDIEEARRLLGPHGADELNIPSWAKPFASKVLERVSREVLPALEEVARNLFSGGIFSLSDALYDVAKERGINNEALLRLVKMLPEFEALMYYLNVKKYYRDHCAHQLRVAILGDFFLDLESAVGPVGDLLKEKLGFSSEEMRTAWWFAGLLHDTGIPLAKLSTAVNWSLLNEILRCYSFLDIEASPMHINLAGAKLGNQEYLSILVDGAPRRWRKALEKGLGMASDSDRTVLFNAGYSEKDEYHPEDLHVDHGVVGAVNLLRTLGPPDRLRKALPEDRPFIEAARAMAVHNFKKELGFIAFEESPLAFLLVLTDELQEWSRPVPVAVKDTYFTTSLEKVTLLDAIYYDKTYEIWDIPYTNLEAKKLAEFDFKRLCKDKKDALEILDCTETFPESQVQLRNMHEEKSKRDESFSIEVRSK